MLLFLLLVFLSAVPIETEVVESFTNCPSFFVQNTPPEIPNILVGGNILDQNRYKVICQTFENKRRFLTLYDTKNKIPVFSAYRFTGGGGNRPDEPWKIEPQLENNEENMRLQRSDTLRNQATNSDYKNNKRYHRGHLYPNLHVLDRDAKRSTFTLTNAVPQLESFNCGNWAKLENRTKCYMEKNCINASGQVEAFVVTGAEPGNSKLKNRINIPSRMWSAFCCYNSRDGVWLSKAYWGWNEFKGQVTEISYEEMEQIFGIKVFPESLCSFQNIVDPSRTNSCDEEFPLQLEVITDTAPPSTTHKTSPSEKTSFPPNTTPTSPMTPKTTTTLAAATKTTQPTTITSGSALVINQEDCEEDEETNKKRWRSWD